jgi:predicted regulator of Ras-like GTPase activity (Roadblock/LC7/MglB family)
MRTGAIMEHRAVPAMSVRSRLDVLVSALPESGGAIVLSADGLVLDSSSAIDPVLAEQLSAVGAGIHAMAAAAGRQNNARQVIQTVVEMEHRLLVVMPVTRTTMLAVVFDAVSDLASVCDRITAFTVDLARRVALEPIPGELVRTP